MIFFNCIFDLLKIYLIFLAYENSARYWTISNIAVIVLYNIDIKVSKNVDTQKDIKLIQQNNYEYTMVHSQQRLSNIHS